MSAPEIHGALIRAMAAIGVVAKARTNAVQNYAFRGVDDVVAHSRTALIAEGVYVLPRVIEREREILTTKSGAPMISVRLVVEHVFTARDGSSATAITVGEAMDSGDKATNKAMSAAFKYALTETLLIATYEADRDTEEHSPEIGAPSAAPSSTTPASVETVEALRAALLAAPSAHALALVASRIGKRSEADRVVLRPIYEERAKAIAASMKRGAAP